MYSEGEGVPQNYSLANEFWRAAAETGDTQSMTGLGWHSKLGYGVPKDNVRSLMWFILAAARGNKDAAQQRDLMSSVMPSDQVEEAQDLALKWPSK
jgi:TPR repeat protein